MIIEACIFHFNRDIKAKLRRKVLLLMKQSKDLSASVDQKPSRLDFIDDYRGLIVAVMLLDHVSFYINRLWLSFDKFDPLFPDLAQFWLRYSSEPVAPGFLLVNGVMVWYLYQRRMARGVSPQTIRRYLIERGLFLVLIQLIWVNAAWSGFQALNLDHFGIIGCIGVSMCLLAFVIERPWYVRLLLALLIAGSYPALSHIDFDTSQPLQTWFVEGFITAGKFNSYPVAPWFAVALLGTVIAPLWIQKCTDTRSRFVGTLLLAIGAIAIAFVVRFCDLYGTEFVYSSLLHPSFIHDLKYPPTFFYSIWFFALNMLCVCLLLILGSTVPWLLKPLRIVGKVPLFFYLIHIPILAVLTRRLDLFYREGGVTEVLLAAAVLFAVMVPLSIWFARVKASSKHWLIRMM